jgi:hypothetical protein
MSQEQLSVQQVCDEHNAKVALDEVKKKRKRMSQSARRIGEAYDKLNKNTVKQLKEICREKYGDKLKLSKMDKELLIAHVNSAIRQRVQRVKKARAADVVSGSSDAEVPLAVQSDVAESQSI